MKKIHAVRYFFLIAIIFQSTFSFSQLMLGADLGFVASRLINKSNIRTISNIGVKTGITIGYKLDTVGGFEIIGQILYIQKGGKKDQEQPALIINNQVATDKFIYNQKFKLNYIEIPILLRFSKVIIPNNKIGIFINAGPYLGLLLNGNVNSKYLGISETVNLSQYKEDSKFNKINKIEFGMLGGFGLFYPVNIAGMKAKVTLESRYTFGLTNFVHEDLSRTRYFSFTGGLIFDIEKKKAINKSVPTINNSRSSPRI